MTALIDVDNSYDPDVPTNYWPDYFYSPRDDETISYTLTNLDQELEREAIAVEMTETIGRRMKHLELEVIRACVDWAILWRDDFTDLFRDHSELTLEIMHSFVERSRATALTRCPHLPLQPALPGVPARPALNLVWTTVQAFTYSYADDPMIHAILNYTKNRP